SLSLAFLSLGVTLLGPHASALVTASVAASVITLGLATAWSFWIARNGDDRESAALVAAAAAFARGPSCGYANLFSPWGVHNVGVLGLVGAACATSALLMNPAPGRRAWTWTALAHAAALYAHWTNVFLLPIGSVAALWMSRRMSVRTRFLITAAYAA